MSERHFRRKHLLGLQDLSADELTHLLDTAERFRDIEAYAAQAHALAQVLYFTLLGLHLRFQRLDPAKDRGMHNVGHQIFEQLRVFRVFHLRPKCFEKRCRHTKDSRRSWGC